MQMRFQHEEKMRGLENNRKSDDNKLEIMQSSPINRWKFCTENKRKLNSSLKKLGQSPEADQKEKYTWQPVIIRERMKDGYQQQDTWC